MAVTLTKVLLLGLPPLVPMAVSLWVRSWPKVEPAVPVVVEREMKTDRLVGQPLKTLTEQQPIGLLLEANKPEPLLTALADAKAEAPVAPRRLDICQRHGMHKVTVKRGGWTGWRCRK